MEQALELYIHIPFCVRKCAYCDFLSGPAGVEEQKTYVRALCEEIRSVSGTGNCRVTSIFIGGGTPSILPGEQIMEIMAAVRSRFRLAEDAEISIEANPGTVDREKLEQYRNAGINRISFGCQSADNKELQLLGRIHSFEEFLESYHLARACGFTNINVDLMSGLPGQTCASWEKSLRTVAELEPEHLSAYSLIIEEGTPFAEAELELPPEDAERWMYEHTHEILEEYGYHQYEISNYAKAGRECRHNLGYWKRVPYLGFGIGSASLFEEERFTNTTDRTEYLENSRNPDRIRDNREQMTWEDQVEETMILGLRLTEGVDRKKFAETFHRPMEELYGAVIRKYEDMGLLERTASHLRLTRPGISVSNTVMADFLL